MVVFKMILSKTHRDISYHQKIYNHYMTCMLFLDQMTTPQILLSDIKIFIFKQILHRSPLLSFQSHLSSYKFL